MLITVRSPHHKCGTTTCAVIAANSLACLLGRTMFLSHICLTNYDLANMLGVPKSESKIETTLSQVSSLINSGNINEDELPAYTSTINQLLEVYTPPDIMTTDDKKIKMWDTILDTAGYFKLQLFDIDSTLISKMSKHIEDKASVTFIVMDHTKETQLAAKKLAEDLIKSDKHIRTSSNSSKRTFFIVNRYSANVESVSKIAKRLGVRESFIITIPYDEKLMKYSFSGNLHDYMMMSLTGKGNPTLKQSMIRIANAVNADWAKQYKKAIKMRRGGR